MSKRCCVIPLVCCCKSFIYLLMHVSPSGPGFFLSFLPTFLLSVGHYSILHIRRMYSVEGRVSFPFPPPLNLKHKCCFLDTLLPAKSAKSVCTNSNQMLQHGIFQYSIAFPCFISPPPRHRILLFITDNLTLFFTLCSGNHRSSRQMHVKRGSDSGRYGNALFTFHYVI